MQKTSSGYYPENKCLSSLTLTKIRVNPSHPVIRVPKTQHPKRNTQNSSRHPCSPKPITQKPSKKIIRVS